MDVPDILPQLERLDGEIDDLEEVLEPFLASIPDVSNKLPLLDKAKLYVLVTYALESIIFSSLRLNGVNAKEHPVFQELTRVRQYFEKIKNIENPPPKPDQSLNKEAAIRFIRSDLADNKEVNTKLTEMIAKERAKAAIKAAKLGEKRKAEAEPEPEGAEDDDEGSNEPEDAAEVQSEQTHKKSRKQKKKRKGKKDKSSS
ncbi:hypothetical protein JX265_001609 [Neoarthrinium moseri]|uniref:Exosome complex protein n=1 Tax=Neoarthrinium moseri TaxID=1658444 RepID=A0A9P9WVR5_9PEZI|nr:uncharacterized protein JN550_004004 [Neoarthrinium moseri]KAI1844622.1 hypothetical protein JX266_009295 [Neoarthrinium moseri]KAI1872285.1 hypothetical protein JN550_004004 [Neoarthrinium moseri]KAI1879988.1 hypothetical protein JX265_001609 [Neoarthrinium moseri]